MDVYLPTCDNKGETFDLNERTDVIARLASKHGGCTVIPGCTGWWHPNDRQYAQREPIDIWRVVDRHYDAKVWATYGAWLARLLDQQEVLITVTDVSFLPHGQT